MVVLAEIGDKLPSVWLYAGVSFAVAGVAGALGACRRWLVLLPLPFFLFVNWVEWTELFDGVLGSDIWDEMGRPYAAGVFAAWNLPYFASVGVVMLIHQRRRRRHTARGRDVPH